MVRIWLLSLTFRAAFEIVALAAARLGTIPRAAQSVIMTTDQGALCCPPNSPRSTFLIINICLFQVLNSIPFGIGMTFAVTVVVHAGIGLTYHYAGVAASTRVGNAIGRRDAAGAKFTGHLSALLSVITGTIVMLSLLLAKDVRSSLPSVTRSNSNHPHKNRYTGISSATTIQSHNSSAK